MTDPQQTPIPQPGEIKTIVVVDLNGRTHTYVELLEALTAVYRLPPVAERGVRALVEGVHEVKGGGRSGPMNLDPKKYSPDTVALNPELFGRGPGKRAVPVVVMGKPIDTQAGSNVSNLEATMALHLRALAQERPYLVAYETEYKFHSSRGWRFDFAWPEMKVAVEVEGGQWTNGRHQRGQGYADDCEKYNNAILLGWKVFRFTGDMVKSGAARRFLESVFAPF